MRYFINILKRTKQNKNSDDLLSTEPKVTRICYWPVLQTQYRLFRFTKWWIRTNFWLKLFFRLVLFLSQFHCFVCVVAKWKTLFSRFFLSLARMLSFVEYRRFGVCGIFVWFYVNFLKQFSSHRVVGVAILP